MIYLHNKYQYEMLQLNLKSDSWEYLFIKLSTAFNDFGYNNQ